MGNWYAVLKDNEDNDWGYGSTDYEKAVEMAKRIGDSSVIAEIDGGYDEEGNPTTDPVCVAVYENGIDF